MPRLSLVKPGKPANRLKTPEQRFVNEYMIDRDPVLAAIRAGVASINLHARVKQWMNNAEIRRIIQERTDTADLDTLITPQRIMAGFIDVAFDRDAPSASRNSALRELALMKKMYPEKGLDPDKSKRPCNVMLVPGPVSMQDWNAAAIAQQKRLKEDVRK